MRYTLLELTQLILSALDSDEVNSIEDTVESMQVANLLKSVYYDIAVDIGLPEQQHLFELSELEPSADPDKPTLMFVPSNVSKISWIKYNNQLADEDNSNYVDCLFMPFEEFLNMQQSLRESSSDVGEMTFTTNGEDFEIMYRSDKMPQWYTSVGNDTLIFDSYDSTLDDTLQKSKTMCYGIVYPVFTLEDDFEPELDPSEFSYYINRAKVRAFAELKQAENREAASETRRQKIIVQKRKSKIPGLPELNKLPRYGRKGGSASIGRIPKRLKQGE